MLLIIISLLLCLLRLLRLLSASVAFAASVACAVSTVCLSAVAAASLLPGGRVRQREVHTGGVSAMLNQLRQVHSVSSESLLS